MKLAVAFIFLGLWCGATARCVMRGECAIIDNFPKQCPVDIDPQPIIEDSTPESLEVLEILVNTCPSLALDENGNVKPINEILTCCEPIQIRQMAESLLMANGVLGRCPTCYRNFARQICEMNCSPDQARFVEVFTETTSTGVEYVNEINYRVHEDFMLDAHASCAGVIVPQTGVPAINIMCGSATVCDADAWFGFTGDTSQNPLAPVQVNFLRWPTPEDSMNARALPCNETVEGEVPCSCVDCESTCPVGNEPVVDDICTVLSLNCAGFAVAITFFVVSVTVFTILTLLDYRKMRQNENQKITTSNDINSVTKFFQDLFAKIGIYSASHPEMVIMITSWLIFGMLFGVLNINITSNPIELWSAPDSRSRSEMNYYNSRFGPFYRASQVFLTINLENFELNNVTYGPAFREEALMELIRLENAIENIGRDDGGVVLEEVCYSPNRPPGVAPHIDYCVKMSPTIYLRDERDNFNNNTYLNLIQNCLNNAFGLNCLATWGGASEPEISFGGYEDDILTATTLLANYPISNYALEEDLEPVLEWEQKFIELLHDYEANWKSDFVNVAFGAERSIEDEIERVSRAEVVPIAISYVIMFVYVVLFLGNSRSWKTWFVDSKITVAIGSFIIVLAAIFCALGVMGYMGVTITLLAINVIPFFVLSVGIDNVFLMVNTIQDIQNNLENFSDYKESFSYNKKRNFIFEKMLIRVGPSIFVSSVTQITCFAIGNIANFPAVVTFAFFASISLVFLFIFQITTVIALLSLDYKRASQKRLDIFCCIQKKILNDEDPLNSETPYKSITQKLMKPYSKFLLDWRVKITVAIIFMGMFSASIVMIPQLEIGLDQELALPADSYVYTYLQAVNDLMQFGPPVYFVLTSGLNFTNIEHQNVICGGQMCNEDSLVTQIFLASRYSNVTYIARSSNSWLDDFIDWTGLYGACCRYNSTDGSFCQSTDDSPECLFCEIDRDQEYFNGLRPVGESFERYIPFFLQDVPTDICNRAGLASYSGAVNYELDAEGRATVHDTSFMAYHSPLSTSRDYITAVQYGYEVSESVTQAIRERTGVDVEVFPYSVFYVFYEQYLTMWGDTFASLGYCLAGALVFNLLASGFSIMTTVTVMFTTLMVVVNMMGVMYIWNIPLNAVSNINLIVSIGIAVEFCSHIAYAYNISQKPPRERVEDAIRTVGSTIITGITFTNIPIIVLAFSYTEIIEVFFFRMLFSLVVLGFLHGMVFYPVLLSYATNLKLLYTP